MTPEQLDELEALANAVDDLTVKDRDFRAAARTAVPELIAEVRRLRAYITEARKFIVPGNIGAPQHVRIGEAVADYGAVVQRCGAGHENCPGYTWVNGTKRYCSYGDYVDD